MSINYGTMKVADVGNDEPEEVLALRRQCYRALCDLGDARERLQETTCKLYAATTTAIGVTLLAIGLACARGCQ